LFYFALSVSVEQGVAFIYTLSCKSNV